MSNKVRELWFPRCVLTTSQNIDMEMSHFNPRKSCNVLYCECRWRCKIATAFDQVLNLPSYQDIGWSAYNQLFLQTLIPLMVILSFGSFVNIRKRRSSSCGFNGGLQWKKSVSRWKYDLLIAVSFCFLFSPSALNIFVCAPL